MGIKVDGLTGVEEMLLVLDTTAKRRVVRRLLQKGKQLQKLAIKMAPIDEGNLEKAIKMRPDEDSGRERDELGRFTRTEVEIYIDMEMPVPERPGKTVGDYAYKIHEHLSPMGQMNLGDKSNQKQIMNGGVVVGGGFLTRAADVIERDIEEEIAQALADLL